MFERFTEQARQAVVLAQDESRALKHNYIGTEHLLLGLLVIRMLSGERPRHVWAPSPPGDPGGRPRWQFRVETLEGASETWPDQLLAWRQDGWWLVTTVPEGESYRAVLERRGRRIVVSPKPA